MGVALFPKLCSPRSTGNCGKVRGGYDMQIMSRVRKECQLSPWLKTRECQTRKEGPACSPASHPCLPGSFFREICGIRCLPSHLNFVGRRKTWVRTTWILHRTDISQLYHLLLLFFPLDCALESLVNCFCGKKCPSLEI